MSILQKTILDITDISDYEKDHIWAKFENLKISDLKIPSDVRSKFHYGCIYEDDTLDCILRFSVGYIYKLLDSSSWFDNLLNSILQLINSILGRSESLIRKDSCSRKVIFNNDDFSLLRNLVISPTIIPKDLVVKLHRHGISKWKDVLRLSEFSIVVHYGFNGKTISFIYCLRSILLPLAEEIIEQMTPLVINKDDYESFQSLVKKWLITRVKNPMKNSRERRADILIKRMGWGSENPKTLEEVGQDYGVTRERVRQIERSDLEKLTKVNSRSEDYFYPLYIVIDSYLQASSGVASFEELAMHLQEYFKWQSPPSSTGLQHIMSYAPPNLFSDAVNKDYPKILITSNFLCNDCHELVDHLIEFIEKKKSTNIMRAVECINTHCKNKCHDKNKIFMKFNKDFIDFLLVKNKRAREKIRKKDNKVYHIDFWNLKYGRLLLAVEAMLKQQKRSMHFTELHEALREFRTDDRYLAEHTVHGALDRSQNIMLWDRGTFIHRENCQIPIEVIDDIQKWILSKLQNKLPFISVSGVFNYFNKKCISSGMPTETALYTCLREHPNSLLVFPRYPKIYSADSFTDRIPNSVILDDLLREAGGPIPYKEVKKYFLENIGLKSFQLGQLLANEPKAIKVASNKYVHLDNLVFDKKKFKLNFETLILSTLNKIGKTGYISIKKAFNDKIISYKEMGVDSIEMFRSLLKIYPSEKFNVERSTHITSSDKKYSQGVVFKIECLKYIKNKNDFCTINELEEYFGKLGYNQQAVWLIRYCDEIFNYLKGAIIHADSIGWNSEKQNALENIASEEYYNATIINSCYGLIDNILEREQLPLLANQNVFTKLLVADILIKNGNWLVLGNAQNAYVPINNKHDIKSFEDLIYMILKNHYDGAANLEQFQDDLADLGIIQKRLTPLMLGNSNKVIISGQEIVLAELIVNA